MIQYILTGVRTHPNFLAKKSKSTIYVYFDSKEEILLAASKTRLESSTKAIASVLTEDLDILQLYSSLVHIFIETTVGISISYLQSIKKNYPVIWQVIEETTDYFLHLLSKQYKKKLIVILEFDLCIFFYKGFWR